MTVNRQDLLIKDMTPQERKTLAKLQGLKNDSPESILAQAGQDIEEEEFSDGMSGIEQQMAQQEKIEIPKSTPRVPHKSPKKNENMVLTMLKEKFGLENTPSKIKEINGMAFECRAINADMLVWADAQAMFLTSDALGQFSVLEYQNKLRLCIVAVAVVSINQKSLQDVFQTINQKTGWKEFLTFLSLESNDYLAKELYDFYEEEIDQKIKANVIPNKEIKTYICPKCQAVSIFNKEQSYFCQYDGEQLEIYQRDINLPLP